MTQIIPAIDIIGGKCVRLTQGDYNQQKTYDKDPLDMALAYEDSGIERLHLVDLDGAREKHIVNYKVLEKITSKTNLWVDFGGGLKTDEDLRIAFECGAKQVTGGSIAVKDEETFISWIEQYGPEKIILGADVKNEKIAVSGWQEETSLYLYDFLEKYIEKGIKYTISTDVSKDGLLQGTAIDMYREMKDRFADLHIIASGGVASMKDIEQLATLNLFGVIVGKAIYEGRISLDEIERYHVN